MHAMLVDPDATRQELRRVWVIEATLKPGTRHMQPRRNFYMDEDPWATVASDAYDAAGEILKIAFIPIMLVGNAHSSTSYGNLMHASA